MKKFFMNPLFACFFVIVGMALYFGICYAMRFKYGPYDLDASGATDALTYLFFGMAFATLIALQGDYLHTSRQSTYFGLIFYGLLHCSGKWGRSIGWLSMIRLLLKSIILKTQRFLFMVK